MAHSLKILISCLTTVAGVLVTFLHQFFVHHSLGKTGQVLFLNACKITTIIQTKSNDCEETRSGKGLMRALAAFLIVMVT